MGAAPPIHTLVHVGRGALVKTKFGRDRNININYMNININYMNININYMNININYINININYMNMNRNYMNINIIKDNYIDKV